MKCQHRLGVCREPGSESISHIVRIAESQKQLRDLRPHLLHMVSLKSAECGINARQIPQREVPRGPPTSTPRRLSEPPTRVPTCSQRKWIWDFGPFTRNVCVCSRGNLVEDSKSPVYFPWLCIHCHIDPHTCHLLHPPSAAGMRMSATGRCL